MRHDVFKYIRTVPDYPVKGIDFYDLNSLFASRVWNSCVVDFCEGIGWGDIFEHVTHIAGIESRGFVVGQAIAYEMAKPFVMIRKKGSKYPGELLSADYDLEYGSNTLVLQTGILGHTSRVLIADDLIATAGSLTAAKDLVEQTGATVVGAATVVDLAYLRDKSPTEIYSMGTKNG
tara:strand:+ start:4343 stop:4870 length:528 start_codon:yes stop_codon:yes gene_type:complete